MSALIENPYTYIEIQDMFEKQRDKVPFEMIKDVQDDSGAKWKLTTSGRFIDKSCFDIWKDDYIVSFWKDTKNTGSSHPYNRFSDINDFKAKLFSCFGLETPTQISMFD